MAHSSRITWMQSTRIGNALSQWLYRSTFKGLAPHAHQMHASRERMVGMGVPTLRFSLSDRHWL